MEQRQLVLLYHFFHPDEVISARLFSDLAEQMAQRGWRVTAMPAARLYADDAPLPRSERWRDVAIARVWRPALRQASNRGRFVNALFMIGTWSLRAITHRRAQHEVMIVGTDPILSVLVALPWRLFRPRARIIHWCHDLHPEASIADGVVKENSRLIRLLKWLLRRAYRRCDTVVDLGPCMRELLQRDAQRPAEHPSTGQPTQRFETITPWALIEPEQIHPACPTVRRELFGDCQLSCLYSGNLGRAHEYSPFVELARRTRTDGISFCFAGRGARMASLKTAVEPTDANIHFADFAAEDQLNRRLEAGDIHLVSLRENWTGTVVPSKFFGSLAIGRPVLFVGSPDCAIARWINQLEIGWHLQAHNIDQVAEQLRRLAADPARRQSLNEHCQQVYRQHFSQARQIECWDELLNR